MVILYNKDFVLSTILIKIVKQKRSYIAIAPL